MVFQLVNKIKQELGIGHTTKANTTHCHRKEIVSGGMTKNVSVPQNILRLQQPFSKKVVGMPPPASPSPLPPPPSPLPPAPMLLLQL